jgi:exopolysaccharide production protein ExoQ
MSIRTMTLGSVAGASLVILYSMAFGDYLYDPLDGSYSFVGAFSSKNQLGFYASIGIFFAFAALFILRERGVWRLAALACMAICGYALMASQSATSVIATAATLSMMIGIGLILLFAPRARKGLLLFGVFLALAIAFVGLNAGGVDLVLGAFGKDSTLTGRTYLWSEGIAAGWENPIFGMGYYAYWVQGFPEAERLWREFYITARGGFHFHNTFIEAFVELGFVGLVLISFVIIRVPIGHLMRLMDDRKDRAAWLAFGITGMLVVRSFFEVDVINPYHVGSFLLYYCAGLLASPKRVPRTVVRVSRQVPQLREA